MYITGTCNYYPKYIFFFSILFRPLVNLLYLLRSGGSIPIDYMPVLEKLSRCQRSGHWYKNHEPKHIHSTIFLTFTYRQVRFVKVVVLPFATNPKILKSTVGLFIIIILFFFTCFSRRKKVSNVKNPIAFITDDVISAQRGVKKFDRTNPGAPKGQLLSCDFFS